MNKIYTATIKNELQAIDIKSNQTSTLFPGDMVSIVDANNGYYYILEYNTIHSEAIINLTNTASDYIVGKWINKSMISSSNLTDTGLETDYNKITSKGNSNKSFDGPNGSCTESLYASYSVTPRTEEAKILSSPKVALDVRRNTYEYTVDRITKKNDNSYIINGVEYLTALESSIATTGIDNSSLPIKSLIGILGIPHQFLAITDPRIISDKRLDNVELGRVYASNIIKTIPLLLITPGVPHFSVKTNAGFNASISDFFGNLSRSSGSGNVFNTSNSGAGISTDYRGKYYSLEFAYKEYYDYVNTMLRAAARFLNIHEEEFHGQKLGIEMQWDTYNANLFTSTSDFAQKLLSGLKNALSLVGFNNSSTATNFSDCVAFYANCGETVTDTFNTSVTQSTLASSLNNVTEIAREARFVTGGLFNGDITSVASDAASGIKTGIESAFGQNIATAILTKAQTLIAGGRLVFPDIWQDSDFGRQYTISMKLVSPSADKLSIFLCLLVPLYHVLALVLPRQYEGDQGYIEPFLLRMYYKGKFNIDMGIATSLSIIRGAEAEWSKDGLPTVLEIQMGVKDLYSKYFMSGSFDLIYSNITELDYIANTCGININTSEASRAIMLWKTISGTNMISDYMHNINLGLTQWVNQRLSNIFGYY